MTAHFRVIVTLLYLLTATACSPTHYVTMEKLRKSLPEKPVVAGFDIDDTVLFSSPGFHYALTNHDGPDGANRYGEQPLESKVFWNDMNGQFDKFSLPKKSGKALVRMHADRGDTIIFITARDSSQVSIVPQILMQTFGIAKPDVIFTCNQSKAPSIVANHITIYYGDSDSDITAAQKANARPIRVLRPPLSNNPYSYDEVGKLGEEVLKGSAE